MLLNCVVLFEQKPYLLKIQLNHEFQVSFVQTSRNGKTIIHLLDKIKCPINSTIVLTNCDNKCFSICTACVNHFVASVRPLHLLFLEGFEYHRQSMILSSLLFPYLYQNRRGIRNRRGPNWPLGYVISDLSFTRCCSIDGNTLLSAWQKIVFPHTDFIINSDFLEFVQ